MIFLLISVICFTLVAIAIPKRLKRSELYAIALFSIVIGFTSDVIFDLKYDVYGYFTKGVQFPGFIPILGLFPTSGVIYLNFYPYKKSLRNQAGYILCWTIFSLIFEFLSVKSGYFYHNGWQYWHSAVAYPILLLVLLLHLKWVRRYFKEKR